MNLVLHPQARVDLEKSAEWYRSNAGFLVAAEFIDAYAQTAQLILQRPEIGRLGHLGTRSLSFPRFPYSLIYRIEAKAIVIVAIAHWRRRPEYWR